MHTIIMKKIKKMNKEKLQKMRNIYHCNECRKFHRSELEHCSDLPMKPFSHCAFQEYGE